MGTRKMGRPTDQRMAILRNQVTTLLWNGKIETTQDRAREVRSMAEKLITLAISEYKNTVVVTKQVDNEKGQTVALEVKNDSPSRLHARRQILAVLYPVKPLKGAKESKSEYHERTGAVKHPLVEKLFNELAPKYDKRAQEKGTAGGYTRILKMGPRRGDAAEVVRLELV